MKVALNKYNVPEVLSALFKALGAAGLDDAAKKLKDMKVPQLLDKAWKQRLKVTGGDMTTHKQAIDPKKALSILMASLQPYVWHYDKFIAALVKKMPDILGEVFVDPAPQWKQFRAISTEFETVEGSRQTGGYGHPGGDQWSPPEYAEAEVEIATAIKAVVVYWIPMRELEYVIVKRLGPLISDKRNFVASFRTLFAANTAKMLIRLVSETAKPIVMKENWDDILEDSGMSDQFLLGPTGWHPDKVTIGKPKGQPVITGKLKGPALVFDVTLPLAVKVEVSSESAPEDSGPDRHHRYSGAALEQAWGTTISRVAKLNLRRTLPELFEDSRPYIKDYDKFIKLLIKKLDSILSDAMGDPVPSWSDFKTLSTSYQTLVGDQIGGYGMGDDWSPPEYAETEVAVANDIQAAVEIPIPEIDLAKSMVKHLKPLISNPSRFIAAFRDLCKAEWTTLEKLIKQEFPIHSSGWSDFLEDFDIDDKTNVIAPDGDATVDGARLGSAYDPHITVDSRGSSFEVFLRFKASVDDVSLRD